MFLSPAIFSNAQLPFNRGVNMSGWFQSNDMHRFQFSKFSKQDFVQIKSLGCDAVRLPINMHGFTSGSPNYTLDPLFVSFLDSVVNWVEDLQINLILDNHSPDAGSGTDPNVGTILVKVWSQVAQHYKNRSNYIFYEILNEPNGITTATWSTIQQTVINAIRAQDTKHTIVVGGSGFNSYNELANLPTYSDNNLIYTFHYYDPFLFTHQGATWFTPSFASISGVPFPYDATRMPACPSDIIGTWGQSLFNTYSNDGTAAQIQKWLDIAINFKNTRKVKVWCGEFGVYNLNSDPTDRVNWYGVVRPYLEANGIAWTTWDYKGSFGLFNKNSNEMFDYDLNTALLQKLGLNVPAQKIYTPKPTDHGFMIYSDFIGNYLVESGSGNGTIDFYNTTQPNNGAYCMYWAGSSEYNGLGTQFLPTIDLSQLKNNNYALDFMIRGTTTGAKFDIRFIDITNSSTLHPWRMRYTVDESLAPWDKKWHHVRIPLTNMTEQGAWDNGVWFNPVGKFDWTAIDRFEIEAEEADLGSAEFWFDNIAISNLDTAKVYNNTVLSVANIISSNKNQLSVFPNPASRNATINYYLATNENVEISIYNLKGSKITTLVNQKQEAGNHFVNWSIENKTTTGSLSGIYFCKLSTSSSSSVCQIVIL